MRKKKTERKNKLLDLNKSIFPYLIGLTYFFLLLESYKYIGFLRKYILVDSRFFLVLSLLSIVFIFYDKLKDKKYKESVLERIVVEVNLFLFLPLVIVYLLMIYLNARNYPNYVFATYHIQPQNFINIVYLSLALLLLRYEYFYKRLNLEVYFDRFEIVSDRMNAREKLLLFFIIFLLFFYFVSNFIRLFRNVSDDFSFMLTHLNYSYDEKIKYSIGSVVYDYILFVKNNTPSESVILIPPQSYPWPYTSNAAYIRYFLYPRKLVNGREKEPGVDMGKLDYVLIDYGESNISEYGHTNIWPKFDVAGEYKIIWNPETNNFWKDKNGYYKYSENEANNLEKWGLIKVKKE